MNEGKINFPSKFTTPDQSINQSFKALSPVQWVANKEICKFMKGLYKRVHGLGIIKLLTESCSHALVC